MKAYTDIEQSKKLASILLPESADCYWSYDSLQKFHRIEWFEDGYERFSQLQENDVYAWSLAALLEVLVCPKLINKKGKWFVVTYLCGNSKGYDNPIDACVEILTRL